jgi:ATP-dependent exoDNAse (exonuclease V) beta subunit
MIAQTAKFIVYKSSAGSGKTFTLVREYLKIVLQNPEKFRQVLAITFTNKAANEMKERVVRNLVLLTDPENNREEDAIRYLLPQLTAQLNLTVEQVKTRAAAVLSLIIHHYAEFAISTIDSFTHRVIRTFAHDLKIPLNFEVELDAEAMLSQAVDLLVNQVGSDELLTRVMVDFVEKKAGDELSWQIEKDLNDFGKALLNESSITALSEIRNYDLETFMKVRANLLKWKSNWENAITKLAQEAVDLVEQEQLTIDLFIQKERSILAYLRNLARGNFDKIQPNSYARTAMETGNWISPKAAAGPKAAFDRIAHRVIPVGEKLLEISEAELPRYTLCKLLLNHLFSTALLSEIEKRLNSLCSENNKLLISEFNRRIAQIVREQPAPFIYERLGEKYHHYLIDEFQDTSILQWHNLLPLLENSLASYRMNLVVGDAKQAIYRWRSGDAEQFEMLPRLIRDKDDVLLESRENALVNNYKKEDLSQNHRSSPVIVEFNNRLFHCIAQLIPDPYGDTFKHATQETARTDKPGMVRIEKIAGSDNEEANYEDLVHDRILAIINELKEDHIPLKDMAILCRKNEKAAHIASYLIREGIPVISSESLLLTQSEQVNFLLAWVRHLADPADNIPKAHILRYIIDKKLLTDIKMEEYFGKSSQQDIKDLNSWLGKYFPFIDYGRLKSLEIFGLIQYLIFHFNLNELNDSYMRFFQDTVLEFVKDHRGGLPEFLEWWEDKSKKASVVIPEGINAVRIMTIHKAKGLQFPVVIYPFAEEQARPTRSNLWVSLDEDFASPLKTACLPAQKKLEETVYKDIFLDEMNRSITDMVNVLYVALTRPEERLYVLTNDFPEKTEGTLSIPKLFRAFFQSEGTWVADKVFYQYGERWQRAKPAEKEEKQVPSAAAATCRPSLKMLLRRHAPEAWDMENPEKNRGWGNLVHRIMSHVNHANQLGLVLDDMLVNGMISNAQKEELLVLMTGILNDPAVSKFFGPHYEVRNEPEIITKDGSMYRPDRILLQQEKATIIDYKTGKPHEEHHGQIREYARLLIEMNYQVEGAYLLYLNKQPEVVRVI